MVFPRNGCKLDTRDHGVVHNAGFSAGGSLDSVKVFGRSGLLDSVQIYRNQTRGEH